MKVEFTNKGQLVDERFISGTREWSKVSKTLNGIDLGIIKEWDRVTLTSTGTYWDAIHFEYLFMESGFSKIVDFVESAGCDSINFDNGDSINDDCGKETMYLKHSARRTDKPVTTERICEFEEKQYEYPTGKKTYKIF